VKGDPRGLGRWRRYASHLAPLIAELEKAGSLDAWDARGSRVAVKVAGTWLPERPAAATWRQLGLASGASQLADLDYGVSQ
jgi:hypothetical protein